MTQQTQNIKEQLEEVIKNELHNYAKFVITENPEPLERRAKKNEISSLIADEVLKVVKQTLEENLDKHCIYEVSAESLLSN